MQARKSRKSKLGLPKKKNAVSAAASVPPPLPPKKKKASAAASTPPPLPELPDIHAPLMTSTQNVTVPQPEPTLDPVATDDVRNDAPNNVDTGAGTGAALLEAMANAAQMSPDDALGALSGLRDEEEVLVGLRQAMTEYEDPEEAQETPANSEKGT